MDVEAPQTTDVMESVLSPSRLETLHGLEILDSEAEASFDRLTRLASKIIGVPISLVSLVDADRQWFKSFVGLSETIAKERETPIENAICKHVVASGQPLIVEDAHKVDFLKDSLGLPGFDVVSYLGIPIKSSNGENLGSFCVIDTKPHKWTEHEIEIVKELTQAVMTEIELRAEVKRRIKVEQLEIESQIRQQELFSAIPVRVFWKDRNLQFLGANELFAQDAGFNSIEELIGKTDFDVTWRANAENHRSNARKVIETGESQINSEERDLLANGKERWILISRVPLHNADGEIIGVLGTYSDITERKQQEEQIRISEANMRAAEQAAHLGSYSMNVLTQEIVWSDEVFRIFGLEAGSTDITFEKFLNFLHPEDREAMVKVVEGMVAGTELPEMLDYRIVHADGAVRYQNIGTNYEHDESGQLTTIYGIVQDVTTLRQTENELREEIKTRQQQARQLSDLRFALDESSIVAITDVTGKITYVNDKFCEVSKYSREELIGKNHDIINSGYHSKEFIRNLWVTIANGQIWRGELKNKAKDGSAYWVDTTIVPFLNEQGKPYQYVAIRYEITDRKQAQDELERAFIDLQEEIKTRQSQGRQLSDLRFALDESSIVAITDVTGKITYVNDKFCEVSKYSREELIGKNHDIINSGYHSKEFIRNLWVTIANGQIWRGELKNKAKDGSAYWVDTTIIPFLNEQGKPYQYIAIRYEITDRKQVQTELERAFVDLQVANRLANETTRLKSEFLATMSHELRTPMNAIEGFTSVMLKRMGGVDYNEKTEHYLEKVRNNSRRLLNLINDFLDLSRIEAGRMELSSLPVTPSDMATKWYDAMTALAETKRLSFDLYVDETLPEVFYGDEEAITKISINLLGNAFKFTDQGGVKLALRRDEDDLVITVEDTGIGIPPHAREYIFDEFRQVDQSSKRAFGGTGLGLAIVHKLARQMNGTVTLQSEVGVGSTFTVRIPMLLQAQLS